MNPILTIGITSYKRIDELERCINSIQTKFVDEIEIIISEDCSPLSNEIGQKVSKIAQDSKYLIKFMPNEQNLGYDGNLGAIIQKSRGKYVFLLSDDDSIFYGFLDVLIPFIKDDKNDYGVIYAPFVYTSNRRKDRNHRKNMIITKGEKNSSTFIFDSILFSGLVFNKKYVENFDARRFLNMNYFQVYLFLKMIYHHGGYYFAYPSVWCIGDGENAYGLSESSGGNPLLVDRTSVISNYEFDKTLFQVIKMFDTEEGTNVFAAFEKQYSFRSYSLLALARQNGRSFFKDYWKMLNNHGIKIYPIAKIYYFLLLLFGTKISNRLTYVARRLVKNDDKCN